VGVTFQRGCVILRDGLLLVPPGLLLRGVVVAAAAVQGTPGGRAQRHALVLRMRNIFFRF
jgi:hypothetical protein